MSADEDIGRGESPPVNTRAVVLVTVGILVALAAVGFGGQILFADRIGLSLVDRHPFPVPGVTPDERAERLSLEAKQRAALNGAPGRLPIEEAMKAIAAKGPRAFDPVGAAP